MSQFTDSELAQLDRAAEKRVHHDAFVASHPEHQEPNAHPLFARILASHRALPKVPTDSVFLDDMHTAAQPERFAR